MGFYFYTLTFFFLIVATALYLTRNLWKPFAPPIPYVTAPGTIPAPLYNISNYLQNTFFDRFNYVRLPTSSTFAEDAEAGLHSSNFNLAENIEAGDSRRGLDAGAKREVQRVMRSRGVGFDEARRMVMEERFGREGIAADGRPLDRKAVMFS
ncbi:hypothetical protein LTR91_006736 [Friedmanniomyces endolithicus]|uniref:Uncharacterized protein n=1 Tax=Friedmanniomyces endolithicus TaxID=329885 RepID=A0AAN6KT14_9PEZI|nr:hypothetical protein LTR94_012472 [Friedmanniomyces endolithicus]KAK0784228.1 hypothetical protein LTR59_011494 [Friedmanniomyces endolithicus]KAK0790629.1 hypothetical protein LTR75_011996 [Friedmanniomyces endolithicus]KAK0803525.1 hypothetical protein LTR38_006099 [Friedmanniomyces endolithicus]KAK0825098.1 hypothetical protein LTR03_017556 [Friedmanniomyces endolithicus]